MDLLELTDSPVTRVISAVAGAIFPDRATKKLITENQEIVTLSYRNSFPRLWNLQSTDGLIDWALAKPGLPRSVVIVWDGMPPKEGTINVADFVLPFDWAFAFSKTLITNVGAQHANLEDLKPNYSLPDLRILILDLASEGHTGAFSYNSLPVFAHAAPWIQVYRLIQADRIELAALFSNNDDYTISLLRSAITQDSLGIEAFLDDLRFPERIKSLREAWIERDRSKDMEMLTSLYTANLLRAGTRHDVGNLLAPLALVEALPQSRRRPIKRAIMKGLPLRTALQSLATVVELQDQSNNSKSVSSNAGIIRTMQDDGDLFGRRSYLKFLLVDDQFWLGYQHLVASFLFGDSYDPSQGDGGSDDWRVVINGVGELRCVSSAKDILTILEGLDTIRNWANPRLLDIGFDILALDLRLWIDGDGKTQFFERLLRVCSHLGTERIQDESFARAFQSVGNGGINDTEQGEIEALALFPLLLSHIDPSLPIILFSSTHQRAVAEMISHRPNIIGEFAKPIFSGYGEKQNRSRPASMLERAITRAIELHESRKVWEELVTRAELVETEPAKFEFEGITITSINRTKKSAEYLITESSINGLASEFQEYILTGRFSDSLLAIGNWSEDVLGGKPDELRASATESSAAVAAVQDLRNIHQTYEKAVQKVWSTPAYQLAIGRVIDDISPQIAPNSKREALANVLNKGRNKLRVNSKAGRLNALGLSGPLPQSPEAVLGRFLDEDAQAQAYLSARPDWVSCLNKDTGSVTISVTNGFRNARAHRFVKPPDSYAIRELAIWCWLWTLAGIFPTSPSPLIERGAFVALRPSLEAKDFIQLKRPLVSSSLTLGTQGAASLLLILTQLKKVVSLGWLRINDAGLDSALARLIV